MFSEEKELYFVVLQVQFYSSAGEKPFARAHQDAEEVEERAEARRLRDAAPAPGVPGRATGEPRARVEGREDRVPPDIAIKCKSKDDEEVAWI